MDINNKQLDNNLLKKTSNFLNEDIVFEENKKVNNNISNVKLTNHNDTPPASQNIINNSLNINEEFQENKKVKNNITNIEVKNNITNIEIANEKINNINSSLDDLLSDENTLFNKRAKTVRNNISNNLNIENDYNSNANNVKQSISNSLDDLLSGDENIFINTAPEKVQNNIFNIKNFKINTDITLQKCSVYAVKAVFDRFVNPDYMQQGKINEFLQNGFSVHNFFVEISNEISTVGGECHQASLVKFILFQFEDLNVKSNGIIEFLKEKKNNKSTM
jgi:hypothetical protein